MKMRSFAGWLVDNTHTVERGFSASTTYIIKREGRARLWWFVRSCSSLTSVRTQQQRVMSQENAFNRIMIVS